MLKDSHRYVDTMFRAFFIAACWTFLSPVSVGPWTCLGVHLDWCAVLHVSCSSNFRICFRCYMAHTALVMGSVYLYFRWSVCVILLLCPVSPPCSQCSCQLIASSVRMFYFICRNALVLPLFWIYVKQIYICLWKHCHDSFLATLVRFWLLCHFTVVMFWFSLSFKSSWVLEWQVAVNETHMRFHCIIGLWLLLRSCID